MPESIPYMEPGANRTGKATANVVGCRFLAISGNVTADGELSVAHAGAGVRAVGVSAWDAASGQAVGIHAGSKMVVPVTAGANIAAGAEVESDAQGRAITKASGVANGYVETAATSGQPARVCLY